MELSEARPVTTPQMSEKELTARLVKALHAALAMFDADVSTTAAGRMLLEAGFDERPDKREGATAFAIRSLREALASARAGERDA